MNFEIAKLIDFNGEQFLVLAVVEENGREFAITNRLNFMNNNPTEELNIFTKINEQIDMVVDNNLINKLLPKFREEIMKEAKSKLGDNIGELFKNEGEL